MMYIDVRGDFMENLSEKNLQILIQLLGDEMDSVRASSYSNEEKAEYYFELGEIEWKLYSQIAKYNKEEK